MDRELLKFVKSISKLRASLSTAHFVYEGISLPLFFCSGGTGLYVHPGFCWVYWQHVFHSVWIKSRVEFKSQYWVIWPLKAWWDFNKANFDLFISTHLGSCTQQDKSHIIIFTTPFWRLLNYLWQGCYMRLSWWYSGKSATTRLSWVKWFIIQAWRLRLWLLRLHRALC